MPSARRKHPQLEGFRHSLLWIEKRILEQTLEDEDRALIVTWIKQLANKVRAGAKSVG